MTDIEFVDRQTITYIQHMGDDSTIVNAARCSTDQRVLDLVEMSPSDERLIHRLIRDGHTSTLEHCMLTVHMDVTIDVMRQWRRHRTQSYNEKSGRYSTFSPRFYIEPASRPLGQHGKPMDYQRQHLTEDRIDRHAARVGDATRVAWGFYRQELEDDVCMEVARRRLPLNTMTQAWATANLNNWFKFVNLRTAPDAMFEIREAASQVADLIAERWPTAWAAYKETL